MFRANVHQRAENFVDALELLENQLLLCRDSAMHGDSK